MKSNDNLFIKILKSIRTIVVTLISWSGGTKIYEFLNHKINVTIIIGLVAILIHVIIELIINFVSRKITKINVLFGNKNKFYDSEFKLIKDSFVDDVAKITLRITVEGNISNMKNRFIDINFPSRTLFTLEADDQSGKTLEFDINDGDNVLRVFLPCGTQKDAKFIYFIKIKLTKNTELINFDNGVTMCLNSSQQKRKLYSYLLKTFGLELKWNKLSADAE